MDLKEKALETITRHSMLNYGDRVLIGLSGGPDSVCLSVILDELRDNFNLSLYAVYVNHGLRPEESGAEEVFCKRFCDGLGISFHIENIDVKGHAEKEKRNLQETARDLRYEVFEKAADEKKATKIALAHNADDQAETVLMRLIRGAGRKGLSGIPPVRGKIIRPLIDLVREDIEAFLDARNISSVADSSNLKKEYARNRLRLDILPLLKTENPSVVDSINRTAEILRGEDEYLEIATTKTMMRLITRMEDDAIELFLVPLMNTDKAILRRVLRRALAEIGAERGIELVHIDDIIHLINENKSGDMINLPKGIRAVRSYSTLLLTRETSKDIKPQNIDIPGEISLDEKGLRMMSQLSEKPIEINNRDMAVLDYDRLILPLQVRKRREGDFFFPAGFGRRKKLQDFFVDEKVPKEKRDSVPIVVSGEDIVWVAGHRMDERYTAKEGTKRFLVLKIVSS
jgi:tRNA(Ile)-lysidine synthase